MDRAEFESLVAELSMAWFPTTYVMDRKTGQILMRYQEKSFTLPASQGITQEQWDRIWYMPPATESENPVIDKVVNGWTDLAEYRKIMTCSNCHSHPESYRHIETCVTPGESD